MRLVTTAGVVAILVGLMALPVVADGVTETSDTLSIVKEGSEPSTAQIAVDLMAETPLDPDRVLIGRDDVFVDSMAAGVLQGASPLLLVPPRGPVPPEVMGALNSSGASRVTLLGGDLAVTDAVADELTDAGYSVDRREGESRFETAIAIARDAGPSDTAVLARAFPAPGAADDTQAFADSLAAGYMAAENGWPILLTQTDVLSGPTRDFMAEQSYDRVVILGGTAAVSDGVAEEVAEFATTVDRIAGPDRFTTGVEIAKEVGAQSAADVARVTLVEGQGAQAWAGGFAAAAHAAFHDAPIVLTSGTTVPTPTEDWLAGGAFAQAPNGVRLTCITPFEACQQGRQALDLPPTVEVVFDPPTQTMVPTGSPVQIQIPDVEGVTVSGSCVAEPGPLSADRTIHLPTAPSGTGCELVLTIPLAGDTVQTETALYTFTDEGGVDSPITLVSADPTGTAVGGRYADISEDGQVVAFLSDGDPTGQGLTGTHVYAWQAPDEVSLVDARPDGSPAAGGLIASGDVAPQVIGSGVHSVVFASPDPQLATNGDLGSTQGTNIYIRNLSNDNIRLLSLDVAGEPVANAVFGAASRDGREYTYTGTGLATEGGSASRHIFIHRQINGSTDVVRDHTEAPYANAEPGDVVMSADGSTLVFSASPAELVAGDTNAQPDVYAYDIVDQTIQRVNVTSQGAEATGGGQAPATHLDVTEDGDVVIFSSSATNLGGGSGEQVYIHWRSTGTTSHIAFGPGAQSAPSIAPDGAWISLVSTAPPAGDTADQGCGVYALNAADEIAYRVDQAVAGSLCPTQGTAVATDGTVAFDSSTAMGPGDGNTDPDVYRTTVGG